MTYKVTRDLLGNLICYGPNDDNYAPTISAGRVQTIELTFPGPTPAQQQAALTQAVQDFMDAAAQAKGYDSIMSACSYAGAPNPFQTEGQSFLAWRAACWTYCYQVQAAVAAGTQPMPTKEQLIAGLPTRI